MLWLKKLVESQNAFLKLGADLQINPENRVSEGQIRMLMVNTNPCLKAEIPNSEFPNAIILNSESLKAKISNSEYLKIEISNSEPTKVKI